MKPTQTCLEHVNALHYSPQATCEVLRRNLSYTGNNISSSSPDYLSLNLSGFRFMSGSMLYRHKLKDGIKWKNSDVTIHDGDETIYFTTEDKQPLAAASFVMNENNFFVNNIQGIKGRKTNVKHLRGSQFNALRYLNWESALLDIIEKCGQWCEIDKVTVSSSENFKSIGDGVGNRLFIRYDVPCIYRGYERKGNLWVKRLN